MDLLRVKKKVVKSQDQTPVIQRKLNWIDLTGTERKFDFKEIRGETLVVFFLPPISKTDTRIFENEQKDSSIYFLRSSLTSSIYVGR